MGFGNIGIGELMMILLVVMVVFGPKRLPEIARNMGKFMRDFRRETNAAIKELKDGIEPIKVGIFDEPDAGAAAVTDNGAAAALPGVAAAGGAGTAAAPVTPATAIEAPGNGARKPVAKRKPAVARSSGARSKSPASAARRKTPASGAATKRPAAKAKSSSGRARASRKR